MNRMICLFVLLLSGCQGLPLLDRFEGPPPPSVMPLWERYQQCLVGSDSSVLLQLVDELDRVMLTGSEPPSWMKSIKSWGVHVKRLPLRTAVDPQSLSAACTLRAAGVLREQNHVNEARALYQRVLTRLPRQHWAYYAEQAAEALAALPQSDETVIAFRAATTPSR